MASDTQYSIFKPATLISYVVKKLREENREQIGKTVIQKIIYLLTRENIGKFNYSLYLYGPYSSEVASELNFAEDTGMLKIDWVDEKGYFITPTDELNNYLDLLTEEEKQAIEKIVEKYGNLNVAELSIVATAFYVHDYFKVSGDKLIDTVKGLKNNYPGELIEKAIKKAGLG